jgi:hypothetical protein
MPRWVRDDGEFEGWVTHALIARWWPGKYYLVGTVKSLGAETTELIRKIIPSAPDAADEFLVQVFKCDRYGMPQPRDPYYVQSCDTKEQALEAHREVVRLLSAGKIKLKRFPLYF